MRRGDGEVREQWVGQVGRVFCAVWLLGERGCLLEGETANGTAGMPGWGFGRRCGGGWEEDTLKRGLRAAQRVREG